MNRYVKYDWICVAVLLVVIAPVLIYAGNAIPAWDDYRVASIFMDSLSKTQSAFWAAIESSYAFYFSGGGIWFASFLNYFLEPYSRWGIEGVRFFCFVGNLFFFLSLYVFIHVLGRKVFSVSGTIIRVSYALLVFAIVNGHQNREIYTWFTGVSIYVVPISLIFLFAAIFLVAVFKEKRGTLYLISAIGAFCASGSSLNITALNCGLFLLLGLYAYFYLGRKIEGIVVFGAALCGGILTAAAPGNFVRHSEIDTQLNVLGAVKNAVLASLKYIGDIMMFSPYLFVFMLIFLGAVYFVDFDNIKINFKHPWAALAVAFIGVVIVNFPVCLGYSHRVLSPRCIFVNDIAVYILSLFWVIYFAGYLKTGSKRYKINKKRILAGIVFLAVVEGALIATHGGIERFTTGYMIKTIADGSFGEYIEYEEGIIAEMEKSVEPEIVIVRREITPNRLVAPIGITTDSSNMWNRELANVLWKEKCTLGVLGEII